MENLWPRRFLGEGASRPSRICRLDGKMVDAVRRGEGGGRECCQIFSGELTRAANLRQADGIKVEAREYWSTVPLRILDTTLTFQGNFRSQRLTGLLLLILYRQWRDIALDCSIFNSLSLRETGISVK